MLQITLRILTALTICFVQCIVIILREACVRGFALIIECIARVWWLMDCYIQDTVDRGVIWFEVLPDESDNIRKCVTTDYVRAIETVWCCFFEAFGVYAAATWNVLGLQEIDDDGEVGDDAFVANDCNVIGNKRE